MGGFLQNLVEIEALPGGNLEDVGDDVDVDAGASARAGKLVEVGYLFGRHGQPQHADSVVQLCREVALIDGSKFLQCGPLGLVEFPLEERVAVSGRLTGRGLWTRRTVHVLCIGFLDVKAHRLAALVSLDDIRMGGDSWSAEIHPASQDGHNGSWPGPLVLYEDGGLDLLQHDDVALRGGSRLLIG